MKANKKTIITISVIVVVISCISVFVFTQLINPLSCTFVEAKSYKYIGDDYKGILETDYKEAKDGLRSDIQLLTNKDYDFSNPDDFSHVILFYDIKNNSVFRVDNIEFFVTDTKDADGRFLCKLDSAVMQSAGIGDLTQIRCDFYMYTKGLDDEEIATLIANVSLEIQYTQNLWGAKSQKISIPKKFTFSENKIV